MQVEILIFCVIVIMFLVKMMNRLKELRKNRNLKQSDVAKAIFTSQQNYSRYENGNVEPDYEVLKKLASFFDVSIDYILGKESQDLILISKEDFNKLKEASDIIQRIDKIANPKVGGVHSIENNTITTNGDVIGDVIIGANIKNK